jgi:hypothetical protein
MKRPTIQRQWRARLRAIPPCDLAGCRESESRPQARPWAVTTLATPRAALSDRRYWRPLRRNRGPRSRRQWAKLVMGTPVNGSGSVSVTTVRL